MSETAFEEYADAAGLEKRDMPSPHHPLLQNDAEVKELADLIDARQERTLDPLDPARVGADDPNLDLENALTLPNKAHEATSAERTPTLTDFDADAKTPGDASDADDESYNTRADLEDDMLATDPDPNAGEDEDRLADAGENRAPDITGTVTGIARGTSTHLPQDGGASGFQIEEADMLEGSLVADESEQKQDPTVPDDEDGNRIPVAPANVNVRDDALDATRQEQ